MGVLCLTTGGWVTQEYAFAKGACQTLLLLWPLIYVNFASNKTATKKKNKKTKHPLDWKRDMGVDAAVENAREW